MQITIIIPAHNEERKIANCLEKVLQFGIEMKHDLQIIVAEDGSSDKTVEITQTFVNKYDNIKLLTTKKRLGKGLAVKNAMLESKKEFVGFLDADLAGDPFEYDLFLDAIKKYDMVIGSRILRGNLPAVKRPFYRTVFSYAYSKFFRVLFRNPIHDPQCGMKLFRKEIISKLFSQIHTTSFAFDSEVIVKAYSQGLKIKEIPINWNHENVSKISVKKQMKDMSQDLLQIWYEAHILWLANKTVYPQKKGSIIGKILFWVLSLYKKPREVNN